MRLSPNKDKGLKGYDFREVFTCQHRYSGYEIASIPNPIPPQKRSIWEGVIPPLDTIEVIRPVQGSNEEEYDPLQERALLTEFIKLDGLDRKGIIRFFKGYGLLGMVRLYRDQGLDEFFDYQTGEPLVWVMEQSRKINRLMQIYRAWSEKDFISLKAIIKPWYFNGMFYDFMVDEDKAGPFLSSDGTWTEGQGCTPIFMGNPPQKTVTEEGYYHAAVYHLAANINKGLQGVSTVGVSIGKTTEGFLFIPGVRLNTLLSCIYWKFRDLVTNMESLKKCIYCGSYFIPRDERQISCPAILRESKAPCKNRSHVKKSQNPDKQGSGKK